MRTRTLSAFWVLLLVVLASSALHAQVGTEGSILGVATDASGAVIAGAEVTVVNLDTGLKKTAVTSTQGSFEILALPRGPYSITVSFTGFKTWNVERADLSVGERKRVSPVLQVGEVSEKVTVEAQAEMIQTEKGSVESIVEQKQIVDLPLNGRNPVELVRLIPGMRYLGQDGVQGERGFRVQGLGARDDMTEYQVDGLNSNAGMDEGGIAIPNVDTIAEFNIETSNFSAEHGRQSLQVLAVTKSGTNSFHGTAWEFIRNNALDARNTFAATKPQLIRNQFGGSGGGPIRKDKTFFFASYEGTRIRQQSIYNSPTINPNFLNGDFSSLGKPLIDPLTQQAFPNNQIPADRISAASKFFYPYILLPNSPGNLFRGVAGLPTNIGEFTGRVDHQFTDKQRIYVRYYINKFTNTESQYEPDVTRDTDTKQQSVALNYTYALTPTTLFTVGANYLRSLNEFSSPVVGIDNLTQEAGINGFPTAGRDAFVGLPSVSFTGYTGFAPPWGVPGRLWFESHGGKASANLIRGQHSLNIGYEYNDRSTYGRHGSCCSRGIFDFNGQYSGDGFADYLLGYADSSGRNYPLQTFGMHDSPYSAVYVQDFWKITPSLTINLGIRYDRWGDKAAVRGNVATFDLARGKIIAGEDVKTGQIDLTAQPVAQYLAPATADMWIPASQAGIPGGLFEGNGHVSPRLGAAWRPFGSNTLVIRGGYGMFTSSFRGNATASAIVGPPYWTFESQGWSAAQLQNWETAWPNNPSQFVTPSVVAAAFDVKSNKVQEWNVSVQKEIPGGSALTVSYVGNRGTDLITNNPHNVVPPGVYADLQAAKPYPALGDVTLYENIGLSWYNGLLMKWEKRFSQGLSYMVSYSFSKHIGQAADDLWTTPTPFAPEGYNRGRTTLDRTHILALNGIYELPFGKGRKYMNNTNSVVNAILGGWQVSGIYNFTSGMPLTFFVPGATLGNGWGTRPNLAGPLGVSNPGAQQWFNPGALSAPPPITFGSAGLGIFDGPAIHVLDTSLTKNFHFTESKYLQFRWEMFNMPNQVNLSNPETTIGLSTTGQIFSAGPARTMQFGLKFIF